jgi:hypothetical protein
MIQSSERVSFELSEFITIEKRLKTVDGRIWYILSLKKDDVKKVEPAIQKYVEDYFRLYVEKMEGSSACD